MSRAELRHLKECVVGQNSFTFIIAELFALNHMIIGMFFGIIGSLEVLFISAGLLWPSSRTLRRAFHMQSLLNPALRFLIWNIDG